MRAFSGLLFLVLTFAAHAEVCVLNFERPESPITKAVDRAFQDAPQVTVKSMALPLDIADCIKRGATEIVIVAHALESSESEKNKSPVPLAYFREFTGEERSADIARTLIAYQEEIDRLVKKGDKKSARQMEKMQKKLENFPEEQAYIKFFPILPRAFTVAARELDSSPGKLRKIRLLSCVPEQVLAYYKDLQSMIDRHGLELDIAPKNRVMSLLKGKTVTSPDVEWLRESVLNGEQPAP